MKHQPSRTIAILFFALTLIVTSASAQDVRLRYKFTPGDVNRYKETTQNDMTSDMMPAGGQKVFSEMYSTQKVEKVNEDGSGEVLQTIDSVSTLLNGQPFSNPQMMVLVGLPVRITVAASGKVLDMKPVGDSTDASVKSAVEMLRKQLTSQPTYPTATLALNVPWEDSATFSQPTQMGTITSRIKYTTKFTGVDKISNTDVDVLERTVSITGDIGDNAGTLKGSGKGNIYFSDVLGKEIRSIMALDESIDMVTPQGPFSMTMKISTRRELLK